MAPLSRYVVSLLARDVEMIFLYSLHGFSGFHGHGAHFGALVGRDGQLHPVAAAHAFLAWMLEDLRPVGHIEPAPGLHAWLFEGPDRAVAVLMPEPGRHPEAPPLAATMRAYDLQGTPFRTTSAPRAAQPMWKSTAARRVSERCGPNITNEVHTHNPIQTAD